MKDIKVSVIVPIYNVEKYLRKCLDSIANQSYTNLEVIMVDDGSTDSSGKIAEEYEEKYSNFKLYRQENLGLGGARNTGLSKSTGEYILMPDSDDWVHPDYVKRLVETAANNDADVVECNGIQVWENGFSKKRQFHINKGMIIDEMAKESYLRDVSYVVWNKIFKRDLIIDRKFTEHMTKQDYAWTPIILAQAKKIVLINDVLYYYLWRNNSATNAKKINYDLLKAQSILESNYELKSKYPLLLRDYFVRNILRAFLWPLSQDPQNKKELILIIDNVRSRYEFPIKSLLNNKKGRRRIFWEWLILNKHVGIAGFYSYFYEKVYSILYKVLLFIRNVIHCCL